MPYRLKRKESVMAGICRVVDEQVERAVGELTDGTLDRHKAVHQVRKRCKKIRGVLRLVRPALGDAYGVENRWYRDAARGFSHLRDAQSILETYDHLVAEYPDRLGGDPFAQLRQRLVDRRDRLAEAEVDLTEKMDAMAAQFRRARQRLSEWKLGETGFAALAGGLRQTYRRGRKAFARAFKRPTNENFHEWRKWVKYHWYHLRLLQDCWRPVIRSRRKAVLELADVLGEMRNLTVLQETLLRGGEEIGCDVNVCAVVELADRRKEELQRGARDIGARVFAETPKAFVARMEVYWRVWRRKAPDPTAARRA